MYQITRYELDGLKKQSLNTYPQIPTIVYRNDDDNTVCVKKYGGSTVYETYNAITLQKQVDDPLCSALATKLDSYTQGVMTYSQKSATICGIRDSNKILVTATVQGTDISYSELVISDDPRDKYNITARDNGCSFVSFDSSKPILKKLWMANRYNYTLVTVDTLSRSFLGYTFMSNIELRDSSALLLGSFYTSDRGLHTQFEFLKTSGKLAIKPYYGQFLDGSHFALGAISYTLGIYRQRD